MEQIDTNAGSKEEHSDTNKVTYLRIQDATCASCVNKIESALNKVHGVEEATMNLAQGTVSVTGNADANALVRAIESAGYSAVSLGRNLSKWMRDQRSLSQPSSPIPVPSRLDR